MPAQTVSAMVHDSQKWMPGVPSMSQTMSQMNVMARSLAGNH